MLDAQTGKYLGDLPLGNVVNGGTYALSDVEYIDGKVVACNYAVAGQELKFYWWSNDCVEPTLLYSTTDLQGAPALGDCFEVNKNATFSESVYFAFAKDDGSASRLVEYERKADGTWAVAMRQFTTDGTNRLPLGKYARVYPWDGTFWLDGCDALPSYMSYNTGINFSRNCDVNIPTTWGACHHEIDWNGKKYSINLNFDDKRNGRGRLTIDNTGNYSSITPRAEFPADGLGNSQNTSGAADIDIKTDGSTYFEAWVFFGAEMLGDGFDAVVAAGAALAANAQVAYGQVQVVLDDGDVFRVDVVEVGIVAHGDAAEVHVGGGLDDDDFFGGAVFGAVGVAVFFAEGDAEALGQFIHDHEANVMPCVFVFSADIAQADD